MIEIRNAGPQTTVQDGGRFGYEHLGISQGGAVDIVGYRAANRLVGNERQASVLECVIGGPVFSVAEDLILATAGIEEPKLNGIPQAGWSAFLAPAHATISCSRLTGARGYIAVAGGFDVPVVLGSRSTNLEAGFGGWNGRAIRPGDRLAIGVAGDSPPLSAASINRPARQAPLVLRAVAGPRFDDFSSSAIALFMGSTFRISHQSNHVGVRLEGPSTDATSRGNRISEPMPIGGVQITPAGQPVVLLPSRGTIGGYPVIATVITPDMWRLGQALPGEAVRFEEIPFDQARSITLQAYEELEI